MLQEPNDIRCLICPPLPSCRHGRCLRCLAKQALLHTYLQFTCVSSVSLSDQAASGKRASVSAVIRPDPPRPPGRHGGGSRRHERLRHAPHRPRHEPRAKPRPLSDADPVGGAAPARPRARQDLPPTTLILPILTRLTQEVMLHRLGQGGHLHPRTLAILPGSSPHVDPPTFKAKPACCEPQCSQYSRFPCHTGTSDSYSDPTQGPTSYCNNKTDPLNYAGR